MITVYNYNNDNNNNNNNNNNSNNYKNNNILFQSMDAMYNFFLSKYNVKSINNENNW